MTDRHRCRREQVLRGLSQEGLDALLVTSPFNVTYLTGFTGDSSYLVLTPQRTLLVSDGRYTTQLAEECPGLELHIRPPSQPVTAAAADVLNKLGPRSVGYESAHQTVADHETLSQATAAISWKGDRDRVERLRAVKDEGEVHEIRTAVRIAERAFAMFRAMLQPGDTEKDLCDALEGYVRRAGGNGTSFPPIVAVGPRSALPHAPPTRHAVGESRLLLIDWGATGNLYKSDLTRILWSRTKAPFSAADAAGLPDSEVEAIHAAVLRAQQEALRVLRPGVKASAVDAAARAAVAEAGYDGLFNHGLGHGIGLQIHEAPFLKPGNDVVLEAGMVVTVEPGIYVPGRGGVRIEDDVLLTPDGYEVLSGVARDLESLTMEF
jgi:Xaa-Pro aminopeptidase